jgi:hypothetical protein
MAEETCVQCGASLRGGGYEHMGERYCCMGCAEGEGCACGESGAPTPD